MGVVAEDVVFVGSLLEDVFVAREGRRNVCVAPFVRFRDLHEATNGGLLVSRYHRKTIKKEQIDAHHYYTRGTTRTRIELRQGQRCFGGQLTIHYCRFRLFASRRSLERYLLLQKQNSMGGVKAWCL